MSERRSPTGFRAEDSKFWFTVSRPVAITMVVLAVAVFGWVSYNRLALTLMPDMSYPTLSVRTEYPGTAPEEIENVISRPLEQELGIIPRLASISSISKAGQSDVILEFQWDTDMDAVAQEIREKVDRLRLPDGAERPLLLHYDPSLDPILRVGLAGPQSLYELRYIAEHDIKRRLEAIDGVAAIKVKGGLEEEFLVALDESKLATLKLDINQVSQRLQQGNVNLPGGNLREGQTEYLIRTLNEFRTLEEIGSLIITRQNDIDIRLRDIATVTRFHKDREIITRVNGQESVEIEIYKEADANVVIVADAVKAVLFGRPEQQEYVATLTQKGPGAPAPKPVLAKGATAVERRRAEAEQVMTHLRMTDFLAYQLPTKTSLQLLSDQSVFISRSIAEVKNNAVTGGLIAIGILYLFLRNVTQTIIISLCIPISIVATFAPMYMADVSLNIISLGGLALGVGNLVDNAIVVLESIFRCREEGDDPVTAVVRGTSEVGMPVVASTFTTVAVFFPIVFVEGVAGQVFGDMALTVVFSQVASLIAALFLIPMLASRRFGDSTTDMQAKLRGRNFLQFSGNTDGSRAGGAIRTLGLMGLRLLLGGALLIAAALKLIFVLASLVIWPALLLVDRARGGSVTSQRYLSWASTDRFIWLEGSSVWPGLLSFAGPQQFADGTVAVLHWCIGSPRVRVVLRLAPALIAFAFLVLRLAGASVFRFLGTLCEVVLLVVAQFAIGLVKVLAALAGPAAGGGLDRFERGFARVQNFYPKLIAASLRHRFAVLGGAFGAFVLCWLLVLPRIGSELIPQVHQGEFNLDVTLPIGTPLERTAEIAGRIEGSVVKQPEVERTSLAVGAEDSATTSSEAGEHTARLTVRLKPGTDAAGEAELIERIRAEFRNVPEVELEITYPALFSFKNPIEVELRGHDLNLLKRLSREAESRLSEVPGLVDLRSTLQTGHPEIQVIYKRERLAEYGLNLRNVAELVRTKVQGRVATEFRKEDRMIDVLVRLREEDRFGLDELRRLVVNPGGAVPIPLSAIADLTINEGPNEIRRIDQQRAALITANIEGADLATVSRDIVATMESLTYPPGFSYVVAGQNEEMKTSLNSLLLAFALALFLVYIVMASQFESLVQPLLIMMTVPLALIGVMLVLWLAHVPLSITVFLGLIILAGIVVNNAIVLVDYINTLRGRGLDKTTAIIEAGRARLRPILMTTLTTVLGLLPMVLGIGEGSEIQQPMAITVSVGLSVSTLLTLVVIPTLYYQFSGKGPSTQETRVEPAMISGPGEPLPAPMAK